MTIQTFIKETSYTDRHTYMHLTTSSIAFIMIVGALTLTSCSSSTSEAPETLEDYKVMLAQKKQEMNSLEEEIEELTKKVAELDPSLQEKTKLVDTAIVQPTTFIRNISIQGSVKADDPVNAVSEIPGRIQSLSVSEGQQVSRGQVIATIDVETYQKQIDEIETSLSLAKDVYDRQSRLWSQNIGSEVQYLQAKNNVDRLEKSLETIRFQMTKSKVVAPISGTVDMVISKQGEVVSPGVPIVQILNTSKLKVTTDLPENFLKIVSQQHVEL